MQGMAFFLKNTAKYCVIVGVSIHHCTIGETFPLSREEPSADSVETFIPQRDTGFVGGQVFFSSNTWQWPGICLKPFRLTVLPGILLNTWQYPDNTLTILNCRTSRTYHSWNITNNFNFQAVSRLDKAVTSVLILATLTSFCLLFWYQNFTEVRL